MLSHEETIKLIKKAQQGDEQSKQILVKQNSPLIKSIIKRFIGKGIEYEDLYQLGSLGFVKAINNFQTEFNVKFSTYVVPMIIGEIKRFMRDDGAIKVSRTIKSFNLLINKYIESYFKEKGKKPTIDEIAKKFNVPSQEIVFAMDSSKMPISLYAPFEEDDDKSLLIVDRFANDSQADEFFNNIFLRDTLKSLNPRDKKIILLRYFRDKTQSEIAKELGVSQVQVSRLETKIIEKIREKIAK